MSHAADSVGSAAERIDVSMKILIAYYTKTGSTARCAAMLRAQFYNHEMTVADLSGDAVPLEEYDTVILGAPIRMGHIDKRMRTFLQNNTAPLADRNVAFFVCCGLPQDAPDVIKSDIPAALLDRAVAAVPVGGELQVASQENAFDKLLVRLMRRSIKNKQLDDDIDEEDKPHFPEIMPDQISRLADAVKAIAAR